MMRATVGVLVGCCLLLTLVAAPAAAAPPTGTVVDCGAGADLQAAIGAASPGDSLLIRGMCIGNFTANKDLTFVGVGHDPTIAAGSGIVLMESGSVTIDGLTISGGGAVGVFNDGGLLTLVHATVRDNTSVGVQLFGGGLAMTHSTVSGNGQYGIASIGTAGASDISNSTISGNGVGIRNGSVMTLSDSTVSGNAQGGIINFSGVEGHGNLTIVGSTISGNSGSGIANFEILSITGSKIVDNATAGLGGGIFNDFVPGVFGEQGRLTMADSKVMGNTASDGGGIYNTGDPSAVSLQDHVQIKHNAPNDCVGC